jgi:hypothetical protein
LEIAAGSFPRRLPEEAAIAVLTEADGGETEAASYRDL